MLLFLSRQKRLHSFSESSFKVIVLDILPTNPVLLSIFFSIQAETEPHKINKSLSFFLNTISQAVLSFPKKSGSFEPIREISSKTKTIFPFLTLSAKNQKISLQSSNFMVVKLKNRLI